MRTSLNKLRCNIIGTKGSDAYIVSIQDTEKLRSWVAEIRTKQDIVSRSEKLFFNLFLQTIHFNQRFGDWEKEIITGARIADGDYLDYAYVILYRAGVNQRNIDKLLGTKRPRGGHYSTKWKKIREEILRRDNYTCLKCDSHKNLEVHHKECWWDNTPNNLITLCSKCHSSLHSLK